MTDLPLATVHGLYHIAIKTDDLAATRKFWVGIIGLREFPRPDFGYPGAWLGCTQPGGLAIIHVYAGGPALGPEGKAPAGTAAIDHVSLSCSGYRSYVARFKAAGLDWREFIVPGTSLWQLFVHDPSGVQLELTFESGGEGDENPDMSPGRKYVAGASFFDKATYPKLFGLDESRRRAHAEVEAALQTLADFDEKAEPLRAIARYIVERDL